MLKLIFKIFLSFFLVFTGNLSAQTTANDFVAISIPKAGTHLLLKCIYMLTGFRWTEPMHIQGNLQNFDSFKFFQNKQPFYYSHMDYSEFLYPFFRQRLDWKAIVIVRDLRDVAVSLVHWIETSPALVKEREKITNLSWDQKLTFALNRMGQKIENIDIWLKDPDVLIIRYEDLIGEKGGGSDSKQAETIQEIATYLNINLEEETLLDIQKNLFGNQDEYISPTFYSGTIGKWESNFKDHHKELFKKRHSDQLILLGYEEDNNW